MSKYLSNQKLWKIERTTEGYFYVIKLKGTTIERIPIDYNSLQYLEKEGVI